MAVVLLGPALFALAFLVHWSVWQIRRPQATGQVLILLLSGTVVGGAFLLGLGGHVAPGLGRFLPGDVGAWVQTVVFGLAISAAYVLTYPAVEVESPIMVIIDLIERAGPGGLERDELYRRLDDDFLVTPRIDDLVSEGLAVDDAKGFRLTDKGRSLGRIFIVWRKILGAEIGG